MLNFSYIYIYVEDLWQLYIFQCVFVCVVSGYHPSADFSRIAFRCSWSLAISSIINFFLPLSVNIYVYYIFLVCPQYLIPEGLIGKSVRRQVKPMCVCGGGGVYLHHLSNHFWYLLMKCIVPFVCLEKDSSSGSDDNSVDENQIDTAARMLSEKLWQNNKYTLSLMPLHRYFSQLSTVMNS